MCGIGVSVYAGDCRVPLDEATLDLIRRRGPDHFSTLSIEVPLKTPVTVQLWSSVLSLRGDLPTAQPAQGPNGVLCFNGEIYEGLKTQSGESDTTAFHRELSSTQSLSSVSSLISSLKGPWAFVYICKKSWRIYIGRDIFGRRCLLIRRTDQGFQLSSVASKVSPDQNQWEEIPAQGIFVYDLAASSWSLMQWDRAPSGNVVHNVASCSFLKNIPLAPESLKAPISSCLLRDLPSPSDLCDNKADVNFDELLVRYQNEVTALEDVLTLAVTRRVTNISARLASSSIGILFSGGIDSTVLTAIALGMFPEKTFELINVAFEHRDGRGVASFDTPDRMTSVEAFEELLNSFVERPSGVRLVCVDVPYDELQKARADLHVPKLVHPADTVLDDSLGFALWFAARGQGYDHNSKEPYRSQVRLLILGMGADEQLGGYSRHAASFKESWTSLQNCIATDVDRISWRNLGRDDRVLADLGKESRTPFLDEDVVSFLNNIPLHVKMRLDLPRGTGDKLILRLLAHKMGLPLTARRAKRALQFGSRIAHVDPKKNKGHSVCNRFGDN